MLKAFAVQEEAEGTGGIFYAKHDIEARKRGANEFGDGDLHGITCRRAPWADEYAPGPCPLLVMIDHGWWMECHGCGIRIDSDMEYIPDEADAPDLELKPVEDDRGLFCTVECRERHLVERMERKIYEQWMVDLLRIRLRDKLPGCVETADRPHVYVEKKAGLWSLRQCVISFTFPGSVTGPGQLRMGDDKPGAWVTVCHGDIEAWESFRALSLQPQT